MPNSTRITRWRNRRHKRRNSRGRRWRRFLVALFATMFVLAVTSTIGTALAAGLAFAAFTRELPDYTELEAIETADETFETTKIYGLGGDPDGDGQRNWELIYEVIDPLGGDRRWMSLDQVSPEFIDATVAIEDKSFWTNEGYDIEGIGRAFYEYVWLGGEIQGGSSITQQLIKNQLIDPERRVVGAAITWDDYRRKAEEVLLASQLSRTYTKEQVLEWYINTNFYGNLAYGVEAAARVYFDKPAALLTLPEAAMLAAIPQSPALNPIDNPEAAKARQELVLEAMLREGHISREQFVAARFSPLEVRPPAEERFDIQAPHFSIYVRKELERRFGADQVLRGGLTVYTSLDLEMQRQAECVARAQVGRLSGEIGAGIPVDEASRCPALAFMPTPPAADLGLDRNVDNAAVVMLDPRTGEIKAMVGSVDYWDTNIDGAFNVAADGLRQPGSAFKPFTYLTAFSQGYTSASMVLDVETDFGTEYDGVAYVPQNYDRLFRGPMLVRQALANSYNVPAVEVMSWVGVDNVIRTARQMGINSLDAGPNRYGLSLTLGGGEVRPLDMAYAFSVFANNGRMVGREIPEAEQRIGFRTLDPVTILRVEDRQNQLLYAYQQPDQREILTAPLAYLINDILSDRTARCSGFGCPNALELPNNRLAAVKTGTTNDFRDAWTVGYTPQLVTAVWVGNTDNGPMEEVPGSKGAAPVWHALMSWALQEDPIEVWPQPDNVVERPVCTPSGLLPTGICPTINELFILGTEPTQFDTMYQEFQINRDNGRLATAQTPPQLIESQTYVVYPDRAEDWVAGRDIPQPPQEYDTIRPEDVRAGVAIVSPQPFDYVQGTVEITGSVAIDNFAFYRIAYYEGLTPAQLFTIVDEQPTPDPDQPLARWDVGELDGLVTILVTAVADDGQLAEVAIPVTIDREVPEVTVASPFAGETFTLDDELVTIQAIVNDDLAIDRVEYYLNNQERPFRTRSIAPFTTTWRISAVGCYAFTVVAYDEAGHETRSDPVEVCVTDG